MTFEPSPPPVPRPPRWDQILVFVVCFLVAVTYIGLITWWLTQSQP